LTSESDGAKKLAEGTLSQLYLTKKGTIMNAPMRKLLKRWSHLASTIYDLPEQWTETGHFPLEALVGALLGVIQLRPALEHLSPRQGIDKQVAQLINGLRVLVGVNERKDGGRSWEIMEAQREPVAALDEMIERAGPRVESSGEVAPEVKWCDPGGKGTAPPGNWKKRGAGLFRVVRIRFVPGFRSPLCKSDRQEGLAM
jgi:hypothetical protein